MKLPDKLPANMQEAKDMFHDLYEQVVEKVTEICNKPGKSPDVKPVEPEKSAAPIEAKKDSENPPT